MPLQVGDVFGYFAAFQTLPNLLVIFIEHFYHKGLEELVHV